MIRKEPRSALIFLGFFSLFTASLFKPSEEQGMYDWLIKPSYVTSGSEIIFTTCTAILLLSFALSLLHPLKKFSANKRPALINLSLFVFVFLLQVISFLSDSGSQSSIAKILFSLLVCIFLTIAFSAHPNKSKINLLLPPVAAGILFIIINSTIYLFDRNSVISPFGRMYGTSDHPNFFGIICATTAILTYSSHLSKEIIIKENIEKCSLLQSRVLLPFFALSVLGVLLSGSRTALLTLLTGLTITHTLNKGNIKSTTATLILAAAAFSIYASYNHIISGTEEIRSLSTENNRTVAWMAMVSIFIENPIIGVGLQNIGYSENSYLRAFAASGIIGGALFLIFLFIATHYALKSKKHIEGRLYIGAILALLVGAVFEGYLVDAFSYPALAFQYMATACISCSTKSNISAARKYH